MIARFIGGFVDMRWRSNRLIPKHRFDDTDESNRGTGLEAGRMLITSQRAEGSRQDAITNRQRSAARLGHRGRCHDSSSARDADLRGDLEVPEVWRHDGQELAFLVRSRQGRYPPIFRSKRIPISRPDDIRRILAIARQIERETTCAINSSLGALQSNESSTSRNQQLSRTTP